MTAFQSFHITTKALIFYKNQFLLHLASDPEYDGALECPGGRVNEGELIEDALNRELQEEIGLDLLTVEHTIELFAVNQRDAAEYDWDKTTEIVELYYKIVITDDIPLKFTALDEVARFEWISQDTDLNAYPYKVASRRAVYEKAQRSL